MRAVATVRVVSVAEYTGRKDAPGFGILITRGKQKKLKTKPYRGLSREAVEAEAEAIRAEAERRSTHGLTLKDAVRLYEREGQGGTAATTRRSRGLALDALQALWGSLPLRKLGRAELASWHGRRLTEGASPKTLLNHLDALSAVFWFAIDRELDPAVTENPTLAFRAMLARGRGQASRAAEDPGRDIRAIEDPGALAKLVDAAAADSSEIGLAVLLALDAGLRSGEVAGLRWQDVWLGGSQGDMTRHLRICNNRPSGGAGDSPPKSGRERRVALSQRLRAALEARWLAAGQPAQGLVLCHPIDRTQPFDVQVFHRRFERVCKRAELGEWRPKDLRSTYASRLLTAGVTLKWISLQLGHSTTQLTERCYARWIGGGEYREPERLAPGELPPDLLARGSTGSTPGSTWNQGEERKNRRKYAE